MNFAPNCDQPKLNQCHQHSQQAAKKYAFDSLAYYIPNFTLQDVQVKFHANGGAIRTQWQNIVAVIVVVVVLVATCIVLIMCAPGDGLYALSLGATFAVVI